MVKRLYLILLLLLAVVAPMSAVLTVDNTEPISDNHAIGCKTIVNYLLKNEGIQNWVPSFLLLNIAL